MSVTAQHAMADKDNVPKNARYEEPTTEVSKLQAESIGSIRAGDFLWIADTTVLADGRRDYMHALKILTDKKVAVREGRTGRVSLPPHSGQFMALDASKRWSSANKGFGDLTPEEAGELGGKKTARHRRKLKLPKAEAAHIWFDKSRAHLKTDEIVAKINEVGRDKGFRAEWSVASLYRAFKGRGVYAGPKVKK